MPSTRRINTSAAVTHPAAAGERLSHVTENYLLSLYVLREEGERLTMGHLASYLKRLPVGENVGTSLPSVAGMVRRMEKEKLLTLTPHKEIRLTEKGEIWAEDMVRRHRLAARMVVDLLGVELYDAYIESHRLEHAISPELQVKILKKLGNPTTSPFGHIIPGMSTPSCKKDAKRLDRASPGKTYIVDRIPEEDQELVRFLWENNVIPEVEVKIKEVAAYRGVLTLLVDNREVALGYEVANRIWIRNKSD